jgi:Mg-chelatase subunit ChlD
MAQPIIDELQRLAALVSLRPEVTLAAGEEHDCMWSFKWSTCHITVNPADLRMRPPDFSRGLVLHEAAHAGLTRLHDILPENLQGDTALRHLLNCIEHCRIERWLQRRLPGCVPWIRSYNNLLFNDMLTDAGGCMQKDPGGAFLGGILCRWWYGRDPANLPEVSRAALNTVWPYVLAAVESCPPADCPDPVSTRVKYASHPISVCYQHMDQEVSPTPLELWTRMTQHDMWSIVSREVLPVFRRLLKETGSPLGKVAEMMDRLRQLIESIPCEHAVPPRADDGYSTKAGSSPSRKVPGSSARRGFNSQASTPLHYDQARARLHPEIERVTEVLLRHLAAETRMRYRRHYPCGQKLDVRIAMQFEADPRLHNRLWQRQTVPTRPDPSFIVLADTSGSMQGERATATFEAIVILRESCLRLDIPLSIVLFGDDARLAQHWTAPNCSGIVPQLCHLRDASGGGTDMKAGLQAAAALLKETPHRHRHLWLLSDGEPNDETGTRREITLLRPQLRSLCALGLGPDTESLAKLVPGAMTNLQASQLPALTTRLFGAQTLAA